MWFTKTVSPPPRGVRRWWFYSINVFFCYSCKSVVKRPCKQSNIAKRLFAASEYISIRLSKCKQQYSQHIIFTDTFFTTL